MTTQLTGVALEYEQALVDYLRLRSEAQLSEAARLGRRALAENLGVLDVIVMHHTALAASLPSQGGKDLPAILRSSALFLCEALSSFEMTHRGYQDASQTIMRMVQFELIVCHELRTPLTSIVSSIGMLQEVLNARQGSSEGKLLDNVVKSAGILKTRTDDLQDLVGFRAGMLSLRPGAVDVAPLLKAIAERMQPLAERADVHLSVEVSEGLPQITADPNRLDQVVSNLTHNALKYAADGKRVFLRAFARGESMIIEVQDFGPGLDSSNRSNLFHPGQAGVKSPGEISGMGIGLALCRELVELHGGTMVATDGVGKGCLFTVELPLSRKAPGQGGTP